MRIASFWRQKLALFLLCLLGSGLGDATFLAQAQTQKALVRDDLRSDATRLEAELRRTVTNAGVKAGAVWQSEADTAFRAGNPTRAANQATGAIAAEPANPAGWLTLSRASLAVAAAATDWSQKYSNQTRAITAAYGAYERSRTRPDEARALAALAQAFEARQTWRPALDAYRLSLAAQDNAELRKTYEDLRAERGFRITDYKIDSDAATPRACFQFSDPLARGKIDFAPFVSVRGLPNPSVTADPSQLCIEGLKHGERYQVTLRQGLPSSVSETLLRSADYDLYVRDRAPSVRFTGRNYVLPRNGQEGLPVSTVNTANVEIDIYRIGDRSIVPTVDSEDFLNQLNSESLRNLRQENGTKVWSGQLATKADLNQDVVTAFPLNEAVGDLKPGIHIMVARLRRLSDSDTATDDFEADVATQWFVVSDLGLTVVKALDGLHVLARSLATAEAATNVEIRLLAKNNEVLATARTDARGLLRFDPGLSRGQDGMAPALIVASDGKGDYGLLDVTGAAFDLSDRGVKGRDAPGALDAMLFPERGVYRPGETVHVTTLLRDAAGKAIENLPLTLIYKRPDGVEHRRAVVNDQGAGGRAHSLSLFGGAARGTWRVQAYADPKGKPVGEAKFLVEDYVPDRIEVTVTPSAPVLQPGAPATLDLSARYLYGAPGRELAIFGDVTVSAATTTPIKGLEDWLVGLTDETVEPVTQEIEEAGTTDAEGKLRVVAPLPEKEAQRLLEARIKLRVGEAGGRGVERSVTLPILPDAPVVAVRKLFKDESLTAGAQAAFELVGANPDGSRLTRSGVTWRLSRIDRRYQWFYTDGRWAYEGAKTTRLISDGTLNLAAAAPASLSLPVDWGSYRLDVAMGSAQTSVPFNVGYAGEMTADTPDLLEFALDKASFNAGDTMSVRIKPRIRSKVAIAVVGDKLHEWIQAEAGPEGTVVSIPAKREWGAGAYLVAFAHRPLDQAQKRMPGRALGVAWFGIDQASHKLEVKIDAPARIRPRGTLDLPVTLAGLQAGDEAFITVSAVDIGILNLTRHETPKPEEFFFGQRKIGAEIRDIYGFLIDGMQGTRGAIRSGGDIGVDTGAAPPREAPLARYSGVVKVGADGKAMVSFDMPAFDGAVRVAVAAWTKDRAGHAASDVIIRDALVVQPTLPRFLSVGDRSRFHVRIDNVEGPAGAYDVQVTPGGPLLMPTDALARRLTLAAGGQSEWTIPVTAAGIGNGGVTLKVTGPGGITAERTLPIQVVPGSDAVLRRVVRRIEPGQSLDVTADLAADLLPGSGKISTSVSRDGGIDVGALLSALDRYPYGCTEQTVSRALPLLAYDSPAARARFGLDDKVEQTIRDAVDRILSRQDANGSFGLWSVGGEDIWLDSYALDFLTRAREKGFAVTARAFESGLDRLRNHVINKPDFVAADAPALAYALYVLARNGRGMMGDLRYIADTRGDVLSTPLARAQIAGALALLGDKGRAERVFRVAQTEAGSQRDATSSSRADYGSRLRDAAALLALQSEAGLGTSDLVQSAALVGLARTQSRYLSTQEQAWLLLAAQGAARQAETLQLTVDGQPHRGLLQRTDSADALEGKPLRIGNAGQAPVELVLSVTGNPVEPIAAASNGYRLERAYHRLDGQKADLASIRQSDRLVVVLTVTELEKRYGRILLVDHLPAGLEIDNPNLVEGGKMAGFSWLKRDAEPVSTEYRDDRFVAAFDRDNAAIATFSVAYTVRAVAPGRYVHPPAVIEDMYRPDIFARTQTGSIDIAGR